MAVESVSCVTTLGVVLAGGRSSRMGVDKSTLHLSGVSFLEHAIKRFSEIGMTRYVVSSNSIDGGVADRLPQIGPLGALDTLINHPTSLVDVDSLMVVPIDMPLFPAQGIKQLCAYGNQHQESCFFHNQPMPFFIYLSEGFNQILAMQIESGSLSVKALLNKLGAIELEFSSHPRLQEFFFNVNTPEQMRQIEKLSQN